MLDALTAFLSAYRVEWMLLLFTGVLYWAFRSRFRRRGPSSGDDNPLQ